MCWNLHIRLEQSINETDSLMYEIKTEGFSENFSKDKEIFDFSIILLSQNIMVIKTYQLLVKAKTDDIVIKEFSGLKPKMHSFLGDDNSEHKKAKDVNKNVVEKISHSKHKKCLVE